MTTASRAAARAQHRDAGTIKVLLLIAAVLVLMLGLFPSRALPESPSGAIEAQ